MHEFLPEFTRALLISGSLGALIGLIRQWEYQQQGKKIDNLAGLRTFALWALIGTISAYVTEVTHPLFYTVCFGLFTAYLVATQTAAVMKKGSDAKNTTFAVSLLTFFIGSLVFWKEFQVAVMLAIITMLILASKQKVHALTRRINSEDIKMALQFAAITGVILPLVPDQGLGPYKAFNPFTTWLMVVLISGLGFIGYILMRTLGVNAGTLVTGFLGGLASSTATTLAFSRQSKAQPQFSLQDSMAVSIACTVMLGRVAFLVGAIDFALLRHVALPLCAMAVPALVFIGCFAWRAKAPSTKSLAVHNPLSLSTAIQFAFLYAIVVFLIKVLSVNQNNFGIYAVSFLSGLTDMDAIAVSLTQAIKGKSLNEDIWLRATILAATANTAVKAGMAISLGSPAMRLNIAIVLGATVCVGVGFFFLV